MKNLKSELDKKLQATANERLSLQRRLEHLDRLEQALKLLLTEEEFQLGGQLALPMESPNGRRVIGRTPISQLLVEVLADGKPRPLKMLAEIALSKGVDFGGKKPQRVLHFALIGLQRNGYAQMVAKSVWQLTVKGSESLYHRKEAIESVAQGVDNHNANGDAVADRGNLYSLFWHRSTATSIRTMLSLLVDNQTGLSDQELRARLSLGSNNQLAGITSGIAKNAKAVGLAFPNIVIKRRSKVGKNRVYHYSLMPAMRDFLQAVNRAG